MKHILRELETQLLTTWCDTLLSLQLQHHEDCFNGGILCPSCLHMHGRIIDLLYPLCYLSDTTKEKKYLEAAEAIFDWGENLYCDDHSYYNDAQQTWNKTTIFFAQSLCQALSKHGDILTVDIKQKWEVRLRELSEWMMLCFPVDDPANTNYHASCCGALAMVSKYFHEERYMQKATAIKVFCEQFISEDHFFYGEGNPRAYISDKGCKSIDIGYSLEESLPGLIEYATLAKDDDFLQRLVNIATQYLNFLLPDGGIDNSFGTRNFKWTYWGSRTSDGCLSAFTTLGKQHPVFLEGVYRQLKLLKKCTYNGYLYGGVDYAYHGERPCIHHMFAHAKVLAACLDQEEITYIPCKLPMEKDYDTIQYYPSLATYKVCNAHIQATITAFNYSHFKGGHVSGGVMSLLWHDSYGAILASGISDTTTREPLNMQLSLKKKEIASSAWRFVYEKDGIPYANIYDLNATLEQSQSGISSSFSFCNYHNVKDDEQTGEITYSLQNEDIIWDFIMLCDHEVTLILPIVARHDAPYQQDENKVYLQKESSTLCITSTHPVHRVKNTFSLAPGFATRELMYKIPPNTHYQIIFSLS